MESEGEDPVLACMHFLNLSLNSDQVESCVFEEPQDRGITSSTKLPLDLLHLNQQQFTVFSLFKQYADLIPLILLLSHYTISFLEVCDL